MSYKILLFIPMYNCENQITRVIDQITPEISNYIQQVIVVNNRSTDHGEERLITHLKDKKIHVKLLRNDDNYGLGGSHKVAFQYAIREKFDYIVVLHGDDQGNIIDLLPVLQSGDYKKYDCCLGARFMKGSKLEGYSKFRTFGNRVYNIIFAICTNQPVYDLGSGLNLYKVSMLDSNFYLKFHDGLMFNYYMILANRFFRFNIKYFPISWRESDQVSNVKLLNQAVRVIKIPFLYLLCNKKALMNRDFRDCEIKAYTSTEVFPTDESLV